MKACVSLASPSGKRAQQAPGLPRERGLDINDPYLLREPHVVDLDQLPMDRLPLLFVLWPQKHLGRVTIPTEVGSITGGRGGRGKCLPRET